MILNASLSDLSLVNTICFTSSLQTLCSISTILSAAFLVKSASIRFNEITFFVDKLVFVNGNVFFNSSVVSLLTNNNKSFPEYLGDFLLFSASAYNLIVFNFSSGSLDNFVTVFPLIWSFCANAYTEFHFFGSRNNSFFMVSNEPFSNFGSSIPYFLTLILLNVSTALSKLNSLFLKLSGVVTKLTCFVCSLWFCFDLLAFVAPRKFTVETFKFIYVPQYIY